MAYEHNDTRDTKYNRKAYGETEDRELYTVNPAPLEYRPDLQREERERTAWEVEVENNDYYTPPQGNDIGEGIVTDLIFEYDEFKNKLKEKLDSIYKEKHREVITFPDYTLEDVQRAMEELGFDGEFTFAHYTAALEKRNTPAGDYLVELAEKQFENLDGDILMELYHDYYELLQEIEVSEKYLHRQSISNMFSEINTEKDKWEEDLLKEELSWKSLKDKTYHSREYRQSLIKDAFLFNHENYQYQKSLEHQEAPEFNKRRTEYNQLKDVVHVTQDKIDRSKVLFDNIEFIETTENSDALEDSLKKVIHFALEPKEIEQNLTQFEQMLTVSSEKHNDEKAHYKNTLRTIYNRDFLEHNLDELSTFNSLYENSIVPLTSVLKIYNKPQDDETTMLLETISSSMLSVREEQKDKTKDFDRLNYATYNVRMKKVQEILEKEKGRQTYQTINRIVSQIKEEGGE